MSKGLEALKEVRKHRHETEKHLVIIDIDYFNECIDNIEKELKALEIIKNKCSPLLKQYLLDLLPKEESELLEEVLL